MYVLSTDRSCEGRFKKKENKQPGEINRERIFYDAPATRLRLLADFDYPPDDLLGIRYVIKQKNQH